MRLKSESGQQNIMNDVFMLKENPFRQAQIYNPDTPGPYVPEMYGDQLDAFYKRFFILPLTKADNRQVIGAIWSSHSGDSMGKGFGKSMLMAEESKRINADFGAAMLQRMGVVDEDIEQNPVLSGYCTFVQAQEVKTFPAALLDSVTFILESAHGNGTVHEAVRRRIALRVGATEGYEGEAIERALREELRKFRSLNIQLNHKTVERFIALLAGSNTQDLVDFIRHEIGPRIKAAQGFNFVHVFNAYVGVAGILYVVYFIDQIENFARFVRVGDRDIKILRESMCQTAPTCNMASFIFQMHIRAQEGIEDWWTSEHLPSLDFSRKVNETRTIDLQGLQRKEEAYELAKKYLQDYRLAGSTPPGPLHPFTEEILETVRGSAKGNPRDFLRTLGNILDHAVADNQKRIDLTFIQPLLEADYEDEPEAVEDDFTNPAR